MARLIRLAWASLLIATLCASIAAQSGSKRKPAGGKKPEPGASREGGNEGPSISPDQQRALGLLGRLFETAREFEDQTLKIRMQAQIADALWGHDEPLARRHFEESFRAIDSVKPEKAGMRAEIDLRARLRGEVLKIISRRDPQLSRMLIESIKVGSSEQKDEQSEEDDETSERALHYLHQAMEIVEADPPEAIQLAKESLNQSADPVLLFKLAGFLQTLRRKDQRLADHLFGYALMVASREGTQPIEQIKWLATYVIPDFGKSANRSREATDQDNPALIRQFLNFAFNTLTRQTGAAPADATSLDEWKAGLQASLDYEVVGSLLPYFDEYLPDQAVMIRARLSDTFNRIPAGAARDQLISPNPPTTVQELLSKAERARQPAEKDALYIRAAMQALQESDPEQAISIAQKISDRQLRSSYESAARYQAAMAAIGREDFDRAYRYGEEISNLQQRARLFERLAQALQSKKQPGRAMATLGQAEQLLGQADDGLEKVRALLIIAEAVARLDPARGFETMKSVVEAINRAETGKGTNSETSQTGEPLHTLNFDQSFPLLARAGFDRALLLAQAIERNEISALAQIALCRSVLVISPEQQRKNADPANRALR